MLNAINSNRLNFIPNIHEMTASDIVHSDPTADTWNKIQSAWNQMMTDINNDDSGNLDQTVKADANALLSLLMKLTPEDISQFNTLASQDISGYSVTGSGAKTAADLINLMTMTARILATTVQIFLKSYFYYDINTLVTSATFDKGGTQSIDLNGLVTQALTTINKKMKFTNIAQDWEDMLTDIKNDKDGSLDKKIQQEAQALRDLFESFSREQLEEFSKASFTLFSQFTTADSKSHQPVDLFSVLDDGLNQLANSATPATTYNQTVNPSIVSATFNSTGQVTPMTFNDMFSDVMMFVINY